MEIQILPSDVVDQIAAGEVVERPAHLIKELIENSLDAGAKRLEIEASEGGRRLKVTDDGHGIAAKDLAKALLRFATSKIRVTDDIWKLSTFGFRGEALASAAAVSRLTIVSRRDGDATAHRLVSTFGKAGEPEPVGGAVGTSVLVEDLFENVPARLKFLKTEVGEMGQIRTTVKALALSRPDIEIRFHENGKLSAFYPFAKSARERAEQVLGVKPLYEGEGAREGVTARAVFAAPSEVAKTSRQIWLFARDRWIQDRGLQAAVMDAYRSLLMHGEYPIAAVWVDCDPGEIDVNIHPTKSQVKFRDPSAAFRAVAASVRTTLEQAPWLERSNAKTDASPDASAPRAASASSGPRSSVESSVLSFSDAALHATVLPKREFSLAPKPALRNFAPNAAIPSTASAPPGGVRSGEPVSSKAKDFTQETSLEETGGVREENSQVPERGRGPWSSLEVLGQAHLTYLLCQNDRGLVFVDQHAAHERVAYERLMNAWKGGRIDVQEFLFPLTVELGPEKAEGVLKAAEDLAKLGISIEPLGPGTIGVKAGPALLKDAVYESTLERMAQQIVDRGGSFEFERVVGDLCATMACHSVVRAGQALSIEQMRGLLREMDEFPLSSFCPHGRPVSVELSFRQLEKDFGRTV